MKSISCLLGLIVLGSHGSAFHPGEYHPCAEYQVKVQRLRTCASASPFCSNFLAGTATFTRTSTITQTVGQSTVTITTTSTSTSTDPADTSYGPSQTVTVSTDATATVTTTADSCPDMKVKKSRRTAPAIVAVEARPTSSCGIEPTAIPSEVSGACQCILASSTQVTVTATSGGAGTTTVTATVVQTTVVPVITIIPTTTVTETTGTTTETACTTPTEIATNNLCNPTETCNTYQAYECADGSGDDCVCGADNEGNGVCVNGATPCAGLSGCATDSDCTDAEVCLVASCCETSVCIALASGCPNPPETDSAFRPAKRPGHIGNSTIAGLTPNGFRFGRM